MIVVITGPTACGKSRVALMAAERSGAEIVSADSMQIYRGMDIGTAKPSADEQAKAPHHLIDIRYPWERYDAAAFARDATRAIAAIEARGKTAMVVGGTALYLKALLEGMFDGPSGDERVRARLRAIVAAEGPAKLHSMLAEVDPVAAKKLHPNDQVRVIRALEVHERTGEPISKRQNQFGRARPGMAVRLVCLSREQADLQDRIERRVEDMFERGLVAETRSLLAFPAGLGKQASQALGYKQVLGYLSGRLRFGECIDNVKQATRQFARKQQNWFRHFSNVRDIPMGRDERVDSVCERLLAAVNV